MLAPIKGQNKSPFMEPLKKIADVNPKPTTFDNLKSQQYLNRDWNAYENKK